MLGEIGATCDAFIQHFLGTILLYIFFMLYYSHFSNIIEFEIVEYACKVALSEHKTKVPSVYELHF